MASELTITIRGPQGAGKTTLAQALAELFSDYGMQVDVEDGGDFVQYNHRQGSIREAARILDVFSAKQDLYGFKVNITTETGAPAHRRKMRTK